MAGTVLRYADVARHRPYHAALVPVPGGRAKPPRPHAHADFHELMLVTHGSGLHRVSGHDLPLRTGDLVLVRPRDEHQFAAAAPDGMSFINVAFPSQRWRAFTDVAGIAAAGAWDAAPVPPTVAVTDEAVFHRFRDALASQNSRGVDLVRLWAEVLPPLSDDAIGRPVDGRPAWLVAACASMADEENLRAGLPRLLELAAVSHGHLARSMAAHLGCTPVAFVTERRLVHAALLLTTTSVPVGQIAHRCGFGSQSYFGRRFAERHGHTPRDHRERSRRAVVP